MSMTDILPSRMVSHLQQLEDLDRFRVDGRVTEVIGLIVEATIPKGSVGDLCTIFNNRGEEIPAEIMGFKKGRTIIMPIESTLGVAVGNRVNLSPHPLTVPVGQNLLGRVIDGMGNPIDDKGPIKGERQLSIYNEPPDALTRKMINEPFSTGIRAIDGLITLGQGQRVGIFSGSGVGKSVLMGMISRHTSASVNIIALVGERGREVREFIEHDLGAEALKRSVVIVATSDEAAQIRVKAAMTAMAVAEYFRDHGNDVMFMMDSLTRVAMAQREIGLAIGEPPTTKGYTPSVFSMLPKLLERAGTTQGNSITGLFTVLVESDDLNDPIADAARSILDGHIVLSRDLANRGHYPAIDVLQSVSRLRLKVTDPEQKARVASVVEQLSVYRESEDLINIGAYSPGSNPKIDASIANNDNIINYLRQDIDQKSGFGSAHADLLDLCAEMEPVND